MFNDTTPNERVEAILKEAVGRDLSSWERHQFLPSIAKIRPRSLLTAKQDEILSGIERRVFGDDEEK